MPTTTYAYVKVSLMRYNRLIGVNMEFVLLLLILLFMILLLYVDVNQPNV